MALVPYWCCCGDTSPPPPPQTSDPCNQCGEAGSPIHLRLTLSGFDNSQLAEGKLWTTRQDQQVGCTGFYSLGATPRVPSLDGIYYLQGGGSPSGNCGWVGPIVRCAYEIDSYRKFYVVASVQLSGKPPFGSSAINAPQFDVNVSPAVYHADSPFLYEQIPNTGFFTARQQLTVAEGQAGECYKMERTFTNNRWREYLQTADNRPYRNGDPPSSSTAYGCYHNFIDGATVKIEPVYTTANAPIVTVDPYNSAAECNPFP